MINYLLPLLRAAWGAGDHAPRFEAGQIFPVVNRQTHAPGTVETASGELIASWYGDPERNETDSGFLGARQKQGGSSWSKPFPLADRPGFPDGNTCMMIDAR